MIIAKSYAINWILFTLMHALIPIQDVETHVITVDSRAV